MRQRLHSIIIKGAVLLAVGCAYYLWLSVTGLGIPCVFHMITGYKCPGCGVTRMFVALIRHDFAAAFACNAVLLCLLPPLLVLASVLLVRYVRTGSRDLKRGENAFVLFAALILLLWGVVRNLPGVAFG